MKLPIPRSTRHRGVAPGGSSAHSDDSGSSRSASKSSAAARSMFVEELEQLARLTAFRPELRLVVGESGSDWSFDWRSGTISVDGGRLASESADFNRGLVLHESAHAAITRLHAIVPLETLKDRRLFALLNVVEDCRIETWMQIRFPGCQPWVRNYNNRLFRPIMAADSERPPAAQFLGGILTRWWFGTATEPMGAEARQALDSVWPAIERVLKALPPKLDALGDPSATYARSPVARCYAAVDAGHSPVAFEKAVRLAQYEMWSAVHQAILPAYLQLLPPKNDLGKSFTLYLSTLLEAQQHRDGSWNPRTASTPSSPVYNRPFSYERRQDPLKPEDHDPYLQSWRRQLAAIELLAERLLRWFEVHRRTSFRHGCPSGIRLNLRAAMRFEADPRLYDKLWSRPLIPKRIDPHFSVVIDRSGSMMGERIEQTFHGTVLLCEVCRRVGLPLNVYTFGSRVERLLLHDEPLSPDVRAKLASLPASARGGTNLTEALEMVVADLGESPFRDRFVIVLSDGEPDDEGSARQQIARLAADAVVLLGLGLGPGTVRLQELLPVSRVNLAAEDVPAALATLLLGAIRTSGAAPHNVDGGNVILA